MLPTPSTDHVSFDRVYEPAEDSFLLLDTLSSREETAFLQKRFLAYAGNGAASPFIVEIGTGSGVVLAFLTAHSESLFGRSDVLTLGSDINSFACRAAAETVKTACRESASKLNSKHGVFLDALNADLGSALRPDQVDILVFNPPYVPTEDLPNLSRQAEYNVLSDGATTFEQDSHLLALSYAGGADGMEITNLLLDELSELLNPDRGIAYVLLCAQNKPEEVKQRVRNWGAPWAAETVGSSGKKGGWEKLQIVRIWRAKDP
ncbi:MAG: S-adenosylmethionine-dependent methyltransferase [Bathelium mastoideum]|nr:MAG: S-adenosylmethionine-dependent methyltransferase [Bathelium mastoideum]